MNADSSRPGPFPLPLLSPPQPPASSSRRCSQRHHRAVAVTSTANSTITSLNQLSASFSAAADYSLLTHTGARNQSSSETSSPSTTQNRLLAHVYRCATRFVSRRDSLESECDDPFFDQNFLTEHLRQADLDAYINRPSATVVPIIADRISLPSSAGSVDLLSLLPPATALHYSAPSSALLLPPAERAKPPRTRLCGSQPEWVKLVRRLSELGMVDFTTQPAVVCGVFAVPKSDSTDRLIIDARPTNTQFAVPDPVRLPTPDLLARLCTDGSRPLFVAKVDLDNFYHRLRLPLWLRPYFALPPVRAGDVGASVSARFGADAWIHPCCVTLPMGWSHSVLVAQLAHEHFLNTRTTLSPTDRITHSTDSAVSRIRHQVYIDDLNLFGTDPVEVSRAQAAYVREIEAVGLVVKPSKVVAPSSAGVECVGLEVNGTEHTVGVSASKLERLRRDTRGVLASSGCSGLDLAHLVGRWTWACLACRPALAVFNAVYRFIDCAGGRRFQLWPSVVRELRVIMGLAPLLFASTSAAWFDRALATDASSSGMGVVACKTEVDPASLVSEDEAASLAEHADWRTVVSAPWRRGGEHINVLELRALCTAARWVLSFRHSVGARVLVLCDSQVVVGAVTKGRSSSQLLLRRLRYLSSLVLASGLRLSLRWVPTDLNPADEPSRRF